jgi:hypothetical protein
VQAPSVDAGRGGAGKARIPRNQRGIAENGTGGAANPKWLLRGIWGSQSGEERVHFFRMLVPADPKDRASGGEDATHFAVNLFSEGSAFFLLGRGSLSGIATAF